MGRKKKVKRAKSIKAKALHEMRITSFRKPGVLLRLYIPSIAPDQVGVVRRSFKENSAVAFAKLKKRENNGFELTVQFEDSNVCNTHLRKIIDQNSKVEFVKVEEVHAASPTEAEEYWKYLDGEHTKKQEKKIVSKERKKQKKLVKEDKELKKKRKLEKKEAKKRKRAEMEARAAGATIKTEDNEEEEGGTASTTNSNGTTANDLIKKEGTVIKKESQYEPDSDDDEDEDEDGNDSDNDYEDDSDDDEDEEEEKKTIVITKSTPQAPKTPQSKLTPQTTPLPTSTVKAKIASKVVTPKNGIPTTPITKQSLKDDDNGNEEDEGPKRKKQKTEATPAKPIVTPSKIVLKKELSDESDDSDTNKPITKPIIKPSNTPTPVKRK